MAKRDRPPKAKLPVVLIEHVVDGGEGWRDDGEGPEALERRVEARFRDAGHEVVAIAMPPNRVMRVLDEMDDAGGDDDAPPGGDGRGRVTAGP